MINIYKRGNLITECYYYFHNEIDNRFKTFDNWLEWLWEKRNYLPTPTRTQNRSFLEPRCKARAEHWDSNSENCPIKAPYQVPTNSSILCRLTAYATGLTRIRVHASQSWDRPDCNYARAQGHVRCIDQLLFTHFFPWYLTGILWVPTRYHEKKQYKAFWKTECLQV